MRNLFLSNDTEQKFLDRIKDNLRRCDSFCFTVSFIKKAGLVLLKSDIEAALGRGCRGRLITSTYQNFTDIESLRTFLRLSSDYPGFECRLDYYSFTDNDSAFRGYHSKGYIFTFGDECEIIIGSSNITRYALLKNIEWDLLLRDSLESDVYRDAMNEFDECFKKAAVLDNDVICKYEKRLNYAVERWDMDYDRAQGLAKPNYMQRSALKELNRYRAMGEGRAITICSAGSGKTYLSAFDALNFGPQRLLYIAHESSILKKALETYQQVFGSSVYCGLYTGGSKESDADFVFATNVLMARDMELFEKDAFDYIVIDECHHAAAESYKKIIDYFTPEFLLGLTATPDRMDNKDVLELFGGNVPYELRLRDAIINGLVVPFHYFGIRDKLVDYGLGKDQERRMIAQLADTSHCEFIIEQIEKHRPEGKLKALLFCRNVTHARNMAEALGERYHTQYLTGKNTVGERIRAYDDLQNDASELEILCSVDILNEGVDIPGVNMVLFLRPTESSTIFIQQLGRGLRKYENKPFVTVLDFIGNSYKRSTQIAMALGSLSQNMVLEKRLMMSMVRDDFAALELGRYGVEIHIDDLSKEEIIAHLESENFNSLQYMKQDYYNFKKYISAQFAPRHMDYMNNDCAPDIMKFMAISIGAKKTGCYYSFLQGIGEEELPVFSEEQVSFLKYMSSHLPLVRPHEFMIIRLLMGKAMAFNELRAVLMPAVSGYTDGQLEHALRFLEENKAVANADGVYNLNVSTDEQFSEHLNDLLEYGLVKYNAEYINGERFLLWHSYSINQVQLKLLENPKHNQKGTYYCGKTIVIFASLKKDASVEERLAYKDKYIAPDVFQWETENNITAGNLNTLNESEEALLFVRKISRENGIVMPFTYVGKGRLTNPRRQDKVNEENGTGITYLYDIIMETPLPDYLQYDFGLTDTI